MLLVGAATVTVGHRVLVILERDCYLPVATVTVTSHGKLSCNDGDAVTVPTGATAVAAAADSESAGVLHHY